VVAALSLGAQAVSMGTRFLASEEAGVTQTYKDRIVPSKADTLDIIGNKSYHEWRHFQP